MADDATHQGLQITYRNWISYSSILSTNVNDTDTSQLEELLVTLPFTTLSSRALYVAMLQKQSRKIFGNVLYVSTVSLASSTRTSKQEQQQATLSTNSYGNNAMLSFFLSNLTWFAALAAATFAALGWFVYLANKHLKRRSSVIEQNAKEEEEVVVRDICTSEASEEEIQSVDWVHYIGGFLDGSLTHHDTDFVREDEQAVRKGVNYVRQRGIPNESVMNSSSSTFNIPQTISVGSNKTRSTVKSGTNSSIARTDSTQSGTTTSTCSQDIMSTFITSNQSLDQIESVLKNLEPNDFNVAEEFDHMEEFSRSTFTDYCHTATPTNRLLL